MDEGGVDAMPEKDQDKAEDEPQHPEAMQEDLVVPAKQPMRPKDDHQGGQGTPKALASTLVNSCFMQSSFSSSMLLYADAE